ncbi:MAG: hypothetical protein JXR96_22615 [Deltaproteobacteria bacterium]|nr:hypothetical protein [Deltaproteobacteria bacterium]
MRQLKTIALATCLVLSWIAPPVLAGPALDKALQLYDDMELGDALKEARKALLEEGMQPADIAKVYEIQGLCLSGMGKSDQAVKAFRRLLAVDPDHQLSGDVSPKLSAPFYQAQAIAKGGKPLTLDHKAPAEVTDKKGLELSLSLAADPFAMVVELRLRFRVAGGPWQDGETVTTNGPGDYTLSLPDSVGEGKLEYYFEALNAHRGVLRRVGGESEPLALEPGGVRTVVAVDPDAGKPKTGSAVDFDKGSGLRDDGDRKDEPEWYETWWFWTAVGVAVVGTGVGVGVGVAMSGGDLSGPQDYSIQIR